MEEQTVPKNSACPNCGGRPENTVEHRLQALGYKHDDISLTCRDCGKAWTAGVPIGAPDSEDLRCDACWKSDKNEVFGRVNWLRWQGEKEQFAVTVKCPRCLYVWTVNRDAEDCGAMMHDPVVAGDDDADNPFA